jgi:hypothetical protein
MVEKQRQEKKMKEKMEQKRLEKERQEKNRDSCLYLLFFSSPSCFHFSFLSYSSFFIYPLSISPHYSSISSTDLLSLFSNPFFNSSLLLLSDNSFNSLSHSSIAYFLLSIPLILAFYSTFPFLILKLYHFYKKRSL